MLACTTADGASRLRPLRARRCVAALRAQVSHEGKYVALAAEPRMVCGVDVAAPEEARAGGVAKKKAFAVRAGVRRRCQRSGAPRVPAS